jgi:serine phosphatase RsbU (regulator of sigma subunit)/CHASE2 domain-containing sensor protein
VGLEPPPLGALRDAVFDGYQRLMPRSRASAPAVIVAIDERALDAQGQWPWPRNVVAQLIDAINAAGPAAVGVDLLFVEPDRSSATSDAQLAQAVQRGKVVMGIAGLEYRDRRYPFPPRAAPARVSAKRELQLRRFDGHLQSRPEINQAGDGRGLISSDAKEVVRRVPLVARIGQVIVPALSIEMLRVATGAPVLRLTDQGGERVALGVGALDIPLQSDGTLYVWFGHHDAERTVSAEDVLSGKAAAELMRDKLVLIGMTGLGLLDFQTTPIGERIPGVEVHAQILEQIFDGDYLRRPTGATWIEAALLAAGGLALVLLVPALRPWISASLVVALLAAFVAVGLVAFRAGYLLDVAAPAIAVAFLFATLLASTLAEADRQRRALREAQARVAGELEAARRIQMGLLPAPTELFVDERRFALAALLEPARTVGGDFYDCFMLDDDRLFFLVGDVSGKGLAASLFMALSKSLLKSIALRGARDPAEIFDQANAEISRDNPESLFVTAFSGILDARSSRLAFCSAGHEPPVLCQPGAAPERLMDSGGPPLCVIPDFAYSSSEIQLAPGGCLCVVTDGVTEAMNARGDLYGAARLLGTLQGLSDPWAIVAAVRDDVRRFAGGAEQSDDLTLLCVRRRGA